MNEENFHKELDLVQGVIERMARNSFYIKGWSISLIAACLTLAEVIGESCGTGKIFFFSSLLLVTCLFWFLDAYFLRVERLYRKHYEWLIRNKDDANRIKYDLSVVRYLKDVESELSIMISVTLRVFHGALFTLVLAMLLYYIFI